jgi:hypothetical protein
MNYPSSITNMDTGKEWQEEDEAGKAMKGTSANLFTCILKEEEDDVDFYLLHTCTYIYKTWIDDLKHPLRH